MIQYWPNQQGVHLNMEVAHLFFSTKQKLSYSLLNKTNSLLYIDLLDNYSRGTLFSIILLELEILILDIVELDLSFNNIKLLNHKILYDLIQKSLKHFLYKLNISNDINLDTKKNKYLQVLLFDNKLLLEYLLIYLIFGSSFIDSSLFAFNNISTPKEHVSILLENLIIQISNIVIFTILGNTKSLANTARFLQNHHLCNHAYISVRSISLFRNSLVIQNLIDKYIGQPKQIYSSRYKVWLISSNGIIAKYIYASRQNDFSRLSRIQMFSIFTMEIFDVFVPQIEKFLLILSKVILYIVINLVGNSAIFCIRMILASLNSLY